MHLITGATGHIGNVLVRKLLEGGRRVRAIVRPGHTLIPLAGLEVEVFSGDILDPDSLRQAMVGIEGVFHLAGMISILPGRNPELSRVNLEGTINVLRAARDMQAGRVVYVSSIHAFSETSHGTVIDESVPYSTGNWQGEYDQSKATASIEAQRAAQAGQDVVLACPTGVVGPFDFRPSEFGSVVLSCVRGFPMGYIHGAAYDFVDVRDVAEGLIAAMDKGRTGESYLLSGEQLTVHEIMTVLRAASGNQAPLIGLSHRQAEFVGQLLPSLYRLFDGGKPAFTPFSVAVLFGNSNISHLKASRELKYQPRPVRDSLHDAVIWFQQNRLRVGKILQSD